MGDSAAQGMAAIGGAVATASAVAPRKLLGLFGIPPTEVTGAAAFGWLPKRSGSTHWGSIAARTRLIGALGLVKL